MTRSATMREWRAAEAPVTSLLFLTSLLITSSLAVSVVIVSPPGDMKVFQGSALSMICEITDLSTGDVSNGQLIWGRINAAIETMTSDGIDYIISNDTYKQRVVSNLTVTNVTYGDEAMYYCSWRQSSQTTDYLNIKVIGRPSITSLELDGEPIAGRKLVITCTVEGKPLPTIEWIGPLQTTSSSLPSSHSSTQARLNNHTTVGRLVLRNLTWDDTGSYRCSAENAHGAMIRASWVNFAPWASISNSSQVNRHVSSEAVVTSLQPTVLYCMAYNILHTDNLQMEWSFLAEGEQTFISLHDDPRMDIVRLPDVPLDDTYQYYYVTSNISFHADFVDQGIFRCDVFRGNNVLAEEERQVFLQDIPRVTLIPDTVGVAIGDDVDVTCRVEAIPPVTSAAWMLNYNVKLPSTRMDVNSYTVDLVYRLQVTSDLDYLNLRTCRASNSEGFVSQDLVIEEKDDCDDSQCTGEHEYCMDIGDSYYCLCDTGYYRDSSGLCVAYSTTPSPTSPTTPSPSSTSTTTPASHHTRSTTEEGGDSEQKDSKQVGLYAGIGAGVVVVVIIIVIVCVVMRRRKQNLGTERFDLKPADTPVPSAPPVASSTYYSNTVFSPFTDPHEYTPLKIDRSEFPRERLQLQDKLGQGKFGTVVRALALSLFQNGKWDTVAVKTHRETATDAEKSEFLRELSLLRSLPRHQHVVAFLGCCTLSDPTYIIMEYCANGDLLSYLRRRRPDRGMFVGHMTYDLTARDFFSFALHVARGMAHVASHKIVHRDVAARNVLMSERNVCKVSDFGLARRVDDNSDVYEIVSRRPLPLRWMSPESLRDGVHTSQSDVWSYGVLLWELVTLGASPYPGNTGKAVIELVTSGTRPVIPPQCRGELADIMTSCWAMTPAQRPTFDVITLRFEKLLEQEGDYLQLDNIQEGIYSILEPSVSGERV